MATRYRLYVVDMADREIAELKHELGMLYGVRVLTLDPVTVEAHEKKADGKRPKPRLGSGDKLGEVPHAPSGMTTTSAPRTDLTICRPCSDGKCAGCFYPFDCPCTSPMHNGAPFERMQVEALSI